MLGNGSESFHKAAPQAPELYELVGSSTPCAMGARESASWENASFRLGSKDELPIESTVPERDGGKAGAIAAGNHFRWRLYHGLLVTDPAAFPVRATDDVDVIVEVASYAEYARFSKRLRNLGFSEDTSEGCGNLPMICASPKPDENASASKPRLSRPFLPIRLGDTKSV